MVNYSRYGICSSDNPVTSCSDFVCCVAATLMFSFVVKVHNNEISHVTSCGQNGGVNTLTREIGEVESSTNSNYGIRICAWIQFSKRA